MPAVFARLVNERFKEKIGDYAEVKVTAPMNLVRNRRARPDSWERSNIRKNLMAPNWPVGKIFTQAAESSGRKAIRVLVPEYYGKGCLACHGGPKGEIDVTGYPKEGGEEGWLAAENERAKEEMIAREVQRRQAEAANQSKTNFLATMSHEIRTPMNGVLGMMGLLQEMELTPTQRKYVDMTQQSGELLLGILNEILDISKIEEGKIELEETGFVSRDVCASVFRLMQPRAEQLGLLFEYGISEDVSEYLIGDPTRIRQILFNLVGNALKFTSEGSVRVSVNTKQISDDLAEIRFEIADTGPGIPPEAQGEIFQKFTQADTSITRKYGGTGLGLSICKHLAELMSGEIGVDSVPGEGATFWFTTLC